RFARRPIQECKVVTRCSFWLVIPCDCLAVGRPAGRLFADIRSIGQIEDFTSIARSRKNIPQLVAGGVLLVEDPFAVGRPGTSILALVGLNQLDGPAACVVYLR